MADTGFSLGTLGQGVAPAASPDALKARRLADLLQQKEAMTTEPIRSAWQGLGRIAQSVAGGYDQYQTDQSEIAARQNAAHHLAAALENNDLGSAIGAMSDPWTNPEAAKTVAGALSPTIKNFGTYEQAVDRFGNKVGPVMPMQTVATGEANGVKAPIGTISGGPGGASITPLQQGGSGGPPVFGANGQLQGNLTGNQGQPPAGAVAQRPAAPVPTTLQGLSEFGNQQKAEGKGMEASAEGNAKYYNSLYTGLRGSRAINAQQKQNLGGLLQVADMPSFKSGAGGEAALAVQRMAAQLGIETKGAAPREVFNQLAAKVLADQFAGIKSMARESGEEGGRIFKPMLDLEEKATINPHDSIEGVKAKIRLMDKAGDLQMKWADMADDYAASHGGRLDAKFDKTLHREIAKARLPELISEGGSSAPDAAIAHLKANPHLKDAFEQKYGPGSAAKALGQ